MVDPWVRGILRCPTCRGELRDAAGPGGDELSCEMCALAYPVREGIPVLLADDARPIHSNSDDLTRG